MQNHDIAFFEEFFAAHQEFELPCDVFFRVYFAVSIDFKHVRLLDDFVDNFLNHIINFLPPSSFLERQRLPD